MADIDIQARWKEAVRTLGRSIGYGNMMILANECWREYLIGSESPGGGENVVGPCAAMTVPCGCKTGVCDLCCGSGWLTKQVATLRDTAQEAYHHFNASWMDDRKDGPVVRALGEALGIAE